MQLPKHNEGFTILELMVALSVFSIAMSIISGLFIQTLHTQKILGAAIEASSNTSLMIEQVSREIRLGYNFTTSTVPCSAQLPDFSAGIAFRRFRSASTAVVVYEWSQTSSTLERTEEVEATADITSPNVMANRICFRVSQNGSAGNPWLITILGNISPRNLGVDGKGADIETAISSRVLPSDISTIGTCPGSWITRFKHFTTCPF